MATSTLKNGASSNPVAAVEGSAVHRFSLEEYQRFVASGMFSPDARIELLDGWIIELGKIAVARLFP